MLVLSRKEGQEIVIGGKILITVIRIKGGKVRLGITAPPGIRVDRHEIHLARQWQADTQRSSDSCVGIAENW